MYDNARQNEKRYALWLIVLALTGGLAGWIVQGLMLGRFVLWALPVFMIVCAGFTINGDNIVESIVVLFILGIILFALSSSSAVTTRIGRETILGGYVALLVAKIGFALVKEGVFGNRPFS